MVGARIGTAWAGIGGVLISSGVGAILGLFGLARRDGRGWATAGLALDAILVASPFLLGARLQRQRVPE